jgi:RNA polymerase sigma-70 factor (ECF subfamily)
MMPNPALQDEPALIEQARRDPQAFAALYRAYLAPIYRYVCQRVGDPHDAEDLTAQVFTEALEGLLAGRYQENGRFVAWLYSIARHKLADFYRQRVSLPFDDQITSAPDFLAGIENSDRRARIAGLLASLDADRQELLRLRFIAGLSFAEIAALDGRSEAAIKMSVYRALAWLREHWEAENG